MSALSFDADDTLGALLIGALISYALFGVTCTQAYIYYGRFPKDSFKIKAMVTTVLGLELGHVICIGHSLYVMVITDYGHPERLAYIPNSIFASVFIGALISAGVQSFFAYRIYKLSNSLWIPCVCWALSLFRLVPSNVVVFAFGVHEPIRQFEERFNWLFVAVWTVSAANDLLIAGTLVFLLYHERARALKKTVAIIDKLIAWTIETGVVTSVSGIIMLAIFVTMPSTFIWMACFLVIARLFSNSLLASLNSRTSPRAQKDVVLPTTTVPGSATTGFIEMNKVTITTYDE